MPEWYQAHQLSTSDRAFVSTDYLTRQLIAYIGNKRRILGFLYRIFGKLSERSRIVRFADPFAGSGSVARLARQMGFEVYSNDWEEYSRVINTAHLTIRPEELEHLFSGHGGIDEVLRVLNGLDRQPSLPCVSANYAPRETAAADYRTERLFYTRENALFIDRVREQIEEWYPAGSGDPERGKARDLLLALLLYEAATHVNTSGVFKAYHKGFGGHGKDALSRIMAPMHLEYPVLYDSMASARVEKLDAASFLSACSADLCYLDPPYTIHQYGSNYHLLNTISLWDFPPIDNHIAEDGRLRRKGGIRTDWTNTRSGFCYAGTAPEALEEVMKAADARYVVLSYNSEGVIAIEQLLDILSEFGDIEINSLDYITYRGGRQSIRRRTHNTEFQIVVERLSSRGKITKTRRWEMAADIRHLLLAFKTQSVLQGAFVPQRLLNCFSPQALEHRCADAPESKGKQDQNHSDAPESKGKQDHNLSGRLILSAYGGLSLKTENYYRFSEIPSIQQLQAVSLSELEDVYGRLREASCLNRQEELQVLLGILENSRDSRSSTMYQKRILQVLKKFTHKKYISEWKEEIARLEDFTARGDGNMDVLRKGLADLNDLARLRFEG